MLNTYVNLNIFWGNLIIFCVPITLFPPVLIASMQNRATLCALLKLFVLPHTDICNIKPIYSRHRRRERGIKGKPIGLHMQPERKQGSVPSG